MKPLKHYLTRWFITRPVLRFGLVVAGVMLGRMAPEYFWPGVAVLALGSLLHLWAKGCLRQYKALTVCGPYRFVRHPFYLSYLVIDIGLCLMVANLYIATVYFPIWLVVYYLQIRREELKLFKLYGKKYADYRSRVPALLPCRLPAPCADGQSFSWSNPNITRRSEIARLIRLAAFPFFFYLAYQIRHVMLLPEMQFVHIGSIWNAFVIALILSLFFFSKLLSPAMRRKTRMLPEWFETAPVKVGIQLAVLVTAVFMGVPEVWDTRLLVMAMILAAWAALSVWIGPLKQAYLPMILGSSAIAVAWQMYWLVPIVSFYYASCAIDDKLFPKPQASSITPL